MVIIASLHVHPVKSCRGYALESARLEASGLEHDREWMIVDATGRFVTQRELPSLALVGTAIAGRVLRLSAPGLEPLDVPLDREGPSRPVVVWNDRLNAFDEGDVAAEWLSTFLGRPLRLVRFDARAGRTSDPRWTGAVEARTRFSDGYALLAISRASLEDLNARLPVALPMERFRPNLVLDGLPPYGEDALGDLVAGDARLRRVKPCTRCVITATDQATGRVDGAEPIRTLRTYRWDAALRGVAFGQNLIVVRGEGATLRAGQRLDLG